MSFELWIAGAKKLYTRLPQKGCRDEGGAVKRCTKSSGGLSGRAAGYTGSTWLQLPSDEAKPNIC